MGRNLVSEGVLSILNKKQNAEGSCGPVATSLSCWKEVAQDAL